MKQTDIGLIPDDWEVKSLGEVATIVGGNFPHVASSQRPIELPSGL